MAKTVRMSDYAIAKLKRETAEDRNCWLGTLPNPPKPKRKKKPTKAELEVQVKMLKRRIAEREPDWREIAKAVLEQAAEQIKAGMTELERFEENMKHPFGRAITTKPLRITRGKQV